MEAVQNPFAIISRLNIFRLSVLGLLTLISLPVFALDLLGAWRAAKAKDPQLSIARYQQDAVDERVAIARSGLSASVTGSANVSRQWVDTNQDPNKSFTSQTFGLNLSYPLYRRQAVENVEQSKLTSTLTELQTGLVEQDLILRVAQTYTDVLAAQEAMRAAQAQRRAAREQYDVVKKSFDAGASARIDLQDAIARADIAQAQEVAARNELLSKHAVLQVLTGVADAEVSRVRPNLEVAAPEPAQAGPWVSQARASNLQVQQAEMSMEIAKREITKQSAGHKPTIDLVGSIGRSSNASVSLIGVNQNSIQLGVQLNVPIYTGGGIDARTREAIALYKKAAAELDSIRDQAEQNVRQALIRLSSGRALTQALNVAVQSSRIALDVTRLGFQSGARVNLDVLNAQQQLFVTRRDLARASYELLLDGLKLKQAAGTLKIDDLSALNLLLLPLEAESVKQ
jgi:outer membrane protein